MRSDAPETTCSEYRDELLRLACGDIAEPSAALRAHLAACASCGKSLATSRELAVSLQAALAPEPLPEGLAARIRAGLDTEPVRGRTIWRVPLRVACTVAAAGLLAALIVPWAIRSAAPTRASSGATAINLSAEDATTIAAAIGVLRWDSSEYRVEALQEKVDGVARALEQDTGARTSLPWSRDDDWDVPTGDAGRSGLSAPALCAVVNRAGSVARVAG